ncbi:hypothetical protein [Saudi moumouvirus]|uniref:Uncharacterized protein n=1 Tax=Moumouvirus sp. 'Monve' TaxID=1128131 RepID=H2ED54_9VIRU|nr:hypothetical protein mv_R122 [Moumouvirus Monve]AQN68659.1 hypothetical protein [Saudi moumouvirus]
MICIKNFSSSFDIIKLINNLILNLPVDYQTILEIVKYVSNDFDNLKIIKIFISIGFIITINELFEIIEKFNNQKTILDLMQSFKNIEGDINEDQCSEKLGKIFTVRDYYHKACEKLNINQNISKKYEPEESLFSIEGNINLSDDILARPGVKCIYHSVTQKDDVISIVKKYSDGSMVSINKSAH